jgi:hypothetical protein
MATSVFVSISELRLVFGARLDYLESVSISGPVAGLLHLHPSRS